MHGHVCASKITQSQVVNFIKPTPQGTEYDVETAHDTTLAKASWAYAHGYQAWYQSSDQAVFAAAATATSLPASNILPNTLASPGLSSGAMPSNTASPPTDDKESSTGLVADSSSGSGLSTGAKAGIGVGVGLAALAVMVLAFVLYRRSKRRKSTEVYRHELPSDQLPIERKSHVPEMMAEQRPVEAYGHEQRHELPGSEWKH
jgi:hypothetical protein